MIYWLNAVILWLACASLFTGCANSRTPISGREQFIAFDPALSTASASYLAQIRVQYPRCTQPERTEMFVDVCRRMEKYSRQYFEEIGKAHEFDQYSWSFDLLESTDCNAMCLPGGAVVVFTGMLEVASSPAELACIIGHEMAHALCKHGAERQGDALKAQLVQSAVAGVVQNANSIRNAGMILDASSLLMQYGYLLPHQRSHEQEADHIGLILMSLAGFDPKVAPGLWAKMRQGNPDVLPSFLSSHPDSHNRENFLRAMLPTVESIYLKAKELGR